MTSIAGRRVMVVEDIYFLAMEVKVVLERAGVEVMGPFATSENAFESLKQRVPDLALLDVNLGGGSSSLDLARALRLCGVPFVFFTGYDRDALPAEFAGVERLEKPVSSERLLQALRNCRPAAPG